MNALMAHQWSNKLVEINAKYNNAVYMLLKHTFSAASVGGILPGGFTLNVHQTGSPMFVCAEEDDILLFKLTHTDAVIRTYTPADFYDTIIATYERLEGVVDWNWSPEGSFDGDEVLEHIELVHRFYKRS